MPEPIGKSHAVTLGNVQKLVEGYLMNGYAEDS
jgi:hypothetical protein